jgi:Zn-dependent peptidase ImmA (M78 family)/DNA-binding XRE family transcriptional regulator
MFNPTRLTLARKRRGMTKADLVQASGISSRSISNYESGTHQPNEENLQALGKALAVPVKFFDGEDLPEPTPDGVSFRAYTRMTAKQRDAALGAGALALMLSRWIDARFNFPPVDVPDLRGFAPEAAAHTLRGKWGLGERPIKNMIHLLEARGIRVFSLTEPCAELNAFSHWEAVTPFVFLNTMKTAESSRFDAAHELAHLVLHRHGAPQGRVAEHEADQFASAFLMSRGSVLASAPRYVTLDGIVRLKKQWNVSALALAHRLRALDLMTEWNYRTICIELSKNGGRRTEIEGIEREASQLLSKVFDALRAEGVSKRHVARELSLAVDDIDALVFGLVIGAVPGRGEPSASEPPTRPQLRLA